MKSERRKREKKGKKFTKRKPKVQKQKISLQGIPRKKESTMNSFKVMTYNIGSGEQAKKSRTYCSTMAITDCIKRNNPDLIFLQGIKFKQELDFIDKRLAKAWKHYHYYLPKSRDSVAIMARANIFKLTMVELTPNKIEGTTEQKRNISENLAIVRLYHKSTKQTLLVASWKGPFEVTDEKKKRLINLVMRTVKKESNGALWVIAGDFNVSYESGTVRLAQKSNGEFFNLVEDTGRIAYTSNCKDNYFIFSGKSGANRLTFNNVLYDISKEQTMNKHLNTFPVTGEVRIS